MYCLQECEHIMGVTHNFENMVCAVVYTVLRFESVEHILLQHFPAYFWGCNTLTHCVYFPHMWNILLKPLTTHNCLLMREAHVWCKRPRTWISLGVVPSSTLWVHQDHLHHQALVRMNWKKKDVKNLTVCVWNWPKLIHGAERGVLPASSAFSRHDM